MPGIIDARSGERAGRRPVLAHRRPTGARAAHQLGDTFGAIENYGLIYTTVQLG